MSTSKNKPSVRIISSPQVLVARLIVLLVQHGSRPPPPLQKHCGQCYVECTYVPTAMGRIDDCPCYYDMLTAGPRKRPKCP
ncbi:hypothetical protein QYE76_063732 [Lolium multiflorum]|uniref:Uncharacterized protein n=1 Tax=Lolium multiflorum TaxID=4521 RepID=A0AAD8S7Z3_LOLMU|nr:hypothetical protein QYE76_063732 [Lolium multiflorum]